MAHGQHVLGAAVERDHRGLVQHDALAARVDEGVGGAEIDGEVASHGSCSSGSAGAGGPAGPLMTSRRVPGALMPVLCPDERDRRPGAGAGRLRRRLGWGSSASRPSAFISREKSSMLDMNVLGLRLRAHTANDPATMPATAMSRKPGVAHDPVSDMGDISSSSTRCWASRPQLSPPSHVSRFQIGTVALSASMREAGRVERLAPVRSGGHDDHGRGAERDLAGAVQQDQATELGPPAGEPRRRWPACGAAPAPRRPRTRGRSPAHGRSEWSRAVPLKTTTAPQRGSTAQSAAAPNGSGSADRPIQSSAPAGGITRPS